MATISRRGVLGAGVAAIPLLAVAGAASAQQPPRAAEGAGTPSNPGGMAPGGAAATDAPLAACVLIKGKKQIEVCNFALTKIQDADVKAFAQEEISEHETLRKKLQGLGYDAPTPMAAPVDRGNPRGTGNQPGQTPPSGTGAQPPTGTPGERGTTPPAGTSPPATGRGEDTPRGGAAPANSPDNPATRGGAGTLVMVGRNPLPAGVSMVIDIDREVGEQCAATAKSELGKLEGVKFDKAFVGNQLHAHYDLLDHAVVFRKHASPAMAPALDEARGVIEKHIAVCKQLMDKLDATK